MTDAVSTSSSTSGSLVDAVQILINISSSFNAIFAFIQAMAVALGVMMMATAWYDIYAMNLANPPAKKYQPTMKNIIIRMVSGSVLVSSVVSLQICANTILSDAANSQSFLYQSAGLSELQQQSLTAIFGFLVIVGYVAFIRGWRIISHESKSQSQASHPGGGYGSGIWHIIGGVSLVYLQQVMTLLGNWTGFDFTKLLLF